MSEHDHGRRYPEIRCHHCLRGLDCSHATDGSSAWPSDGDPLICAYCEGVTIYTSAGGRMPTLEEDHAALLELERWKREHGV